ncbi:hypothetical protein PO909_010522 [Leuciscus waleckii]
MPLHGLWNWTLEFYIDLALPLSGSAVMAAKPKAAKAVPRCSRLASSEADPSLISVRGAGIPVVPAHPSSEVPAHHCLVVPTLPNAILKLPVCPDKTTEVIPKLLVFFDKTTEVVPELLFFSDMTTDGILKLPVCPGKTTEVVPKLCLFRHGHGERLIHLPFRLLHLGDLQSCQLRLGGHLLCQLRPVHSACYTMVPCSASSTQATCSAGSTLVTSFTSATQARPDILPLDLPPLHPPPGLIVMFLEHLEAAPLRGGSVTCALGLCSSMFSYGLLF